MGDNFKKLIALGDLEFSFNKGAFQEAHQKLCEEGCEANGIPQEYWPIYPEITYRFFTGSSLTEQPNNP